MRPRWTPSTRAVISPVRRIVTSMSANVASERTSAMTIVTITSGSVMPRSEFRRSGIVSYTSSRVGHVYGLPLIVVVFVRPSGFRLSYQRPRGMQAPRPRLVSRKQIEYSPKGIPGSNWVPGCETQWVLGGTVPNKARVPRLRRELEPRFGARVRRVRRRLEERGPDVPCHHRGRWPIARRGDPQVQRWLADGRRLRHDRGIGEHGRGGVHSTGRAEVGRVGGRGHLVG